MNIADRKQTTARVYFKPAATNGFLNAGDVASYKFAPEIKYAEWSSAVKGSRRGRCKQPYELHWRWQFNLNEELEQTIKLLRLASAATVVQAAAVSQVFSTNGGGVPEEGFEYDVGWTWLTSWLYAGDAQPVEGVDWAVNAETGLVTILSDWFLTYNLDFTLIFNAPLLLNYTALKNVRATGAFKILEFDQFSEVPRLMHAFDGEARIIATPDHDGSKPAEYELEVTARGPVSTKKRAG